MRKGYLTPPVLIVLALITLFVAAAIFFNTFLLKGLKKEPAPVSTPTIQPSPKSKTDETVYTDEGSANWKTYTHSKLGFSFKYPPNFQRYIDEFDWGVQVECGCEFFDWFYIEIINSDLNPEEWWKIFGREVFNGKVGVNIFHPEAFTIDSQSLNVRGEYPYYEIVAKTDTRKFFGDADTKQPPQILSPIPFRVLIFKNTNNLVVVTAYDTNDRQLFNQILSTFKFLD